MPLNQKQFERLGLIHRLISRLDGATFKDIQEACMEQLGLRTAPGTRTLRYDIKRLKEEYEAPIGYKNGGYYYTDRDYSLHKVLNKDDARFAREIKNLIGQLATVPHIRGLEKIQLEIQQRFGEPSKTEASLVQFDQANYYEGSDKLLPLYEAIKSKQCIKITYRDFAGVVTHHTLSPYVLREYNNRWYIFGWQHTERQLYNLALDRIRTIESSIFPYLPERLSVAGYLDDLIGVTRALNDVPEEILLKVKKPRAYYLTTKTLHKRQIRHSENEDSITFRFSLILNKELEAKILELGADAEVLAPAKLREQVKETVARMLDNYK
jgi:predicted DNA-binding transcriptional regulator YafY